MQGEMVVCTACALAWREYTGKQGSLEHDCHLLQPSSNLATHAVNPLSICCTKYFEAAVDVQVLCTATHEVFLEVWYRYCTLLLLHLSLGGVVQTL